jgi:hypothetical protein
MIGDDEKFWTNSFLMKIALKIKEATLLIQQRYLLIGNRVLHLDDGKNNRCSEIIDRIQKEGKEPIIEILVHGLNDDFVAKKIEAAAIDLIGIENLCNKVSGWESVDFGRMGLTELIPIYKKEKAIIEDPVIIIRINKLYHYGMTDRELYDAARGIWKIGKNRDDAVYAFAVFGGIVREVYKIREWLPAGTTASIRGDLRCDGRWEFVGEVAEKSIREKYLFKSVEEYLPNHAQNPIRYVNC